MRTIGFFKYESKHENMQWWYYQKVNLTVGKVSKTKISQKTVLSQAFFKNVLTNYISFLLDNYGFVVSFMCFQKFKTNT